MSSNGRGGPPRKRRRKARLKRKLKCRFCPDGCDRSPRPVYVDYKDLRTLKMMLSRDGHILGRKRSGTCAKYQHAVRRAVHRARFIGLLPFVNREHP